jgi:hypothetical protein
VEVSGSRGASNTVRCRSRPKHTGAILSPLPHFQPSSCYHGFQMKPALPPIQSPGATEFEKFDNLFRKVITVPKAEVERREKQWQKQRRKKPAKRSP